MPVSARAGHVVTILPHISGQTYELRDPVGSSMSNLFTVMNRGQLIIKSDLLHLQGQSVFLYVEHHHPSLSWSQVLHMDIRDDPEVLHFDGQPYEGHIKENEPEGTIVQGLDVFYKSVKRFPYSTNFTVVSGDTDFFEIKSLPWSWNDVFLLNKVPLDREKKSCYHLVVKAEDIGIQEIFALITIHVDDDNEYKPVFEKSVYSKSISTDLDPLSTIMKLFASDQDKDDVASYLMEDNDVMYALPDTGDIVVKDPAKLKEKSYEFSVHAIDKSGAKSDPASVRVETQIPNTYNDVTILSRKRREATTRVFVVSWDDDNELFTIADGTLSGTETYTIADPATVSMISIDQEGMVSLAGQWNKSRTELFFIVNIGKTDDENCKYFKIKFYIYIYIFQTRFMLIVLAAIIDLISTPHKQIHYFVYQQ